MNITTHTSLLGFLLVLSAFSVPVANATSQPSKEASPSIEGRLDRITATIRHRETQVLETSLSEDDLLMVRGFADGSRGGGFTQGGRRGVATGPRGGNFYNAHPNYGRVGGPVGVGRGAAWADGGGFYNGTYQDGGSFVNGSDGGAAFKNGTYGAGGFVNGSQGGAGFRNW
ncbi:GrrA/OscA1 family cyclophane-containing rSAM-modified RiPP [Lyngbya sp. PCC 8106]|uniref:GrrA/OscA1 family cyclophane-containing rSAM-modified RiPP n=1 Tax=Lyngbya sp. (strain PCC 8106) TaxID=313612 RepID=UPI0000EAC32E|nr:GrrA/OscA1 family cyclophane-containing rSAM-modified RiPP [Lyngbya sp. PCC 8106]EAW33975.1 hypothetical protein L8106_08766 [Lyngbya sp. PCC 8106]